MKSASLRRIPSVEKVLQALGETSLPRAVIVSLIRRELSVLRAGRDIPENEVVLGRVREAIARHQAARIQPVINATGILVHTNLGRSPLGAGVLEALCLTASNYNNLEFDLVTGQRGGRASYLEENLALLCESEAATVVNNCAAALILILRHFTAKKPEVIISRGELVQIGGGFRIPEILEASGAKLCEVGTTNKTSLADYAKRIGPNTALILKVHRSNFFMGGFVESPSTEEIAALAGRKRVPFVEDLGSGAVVATEGVAGVEHEPTPGESIRRGVDLVCFSGDKLLGGPQAGIIAGKKKWVAKLKNEPFYRALRCDKLILTALQATVDTYLHRQAQPGTDDGIPILTMMGITMEELRARAESIARALTGLPAEIALGQGKAQIGGGTLPRSTIPSVTVDLTPKQVAVDEMAQRLRRTVPPVVGYVSAGRLRLDLRTVFPRQDSELIAAIRSSLG